MPSVALMTLGCKVNQYETEVMEGLFKERGYTVVSFDEAADFYIINTCSVTHLGERKSRRLIRRAIRLNARAVVAVTGCYAQVAPEEVEQIEGVRVVVGTRDRGRIVDLVERAAREDGVINDVGDIMQAREFEDIPLALAPGRTRAFLKIQEGCANFCTYCIIPYARGPLRSRPLASVRAEAERLVRAGFKEIVLTGIHLGAYGRDLAVAIELADAVRAVLAVPGLERLRLGSLESIELSVELVELLRAEPRFCPHLHLPLQAGQDEVLRAMNRHYTTAEFRSLHEKLLRAVPGIAVSTDIIVGFPGETEAMFAEGLAFAASMEFAKIHVFPYSKRAGTPAAAFPQQIPESVKKERVQRMQAMADEKAAAYRRRFIGATLPVLAETRAAGIADGLTDNYIRVYTAAAVSCGEIYPLRLTRAYRDGLWGEFCK